MSLAKRRKDRTWKLYYKDRRSLAARRVSPVDQKFRRESFDRVFARREIYIF